MRNFTAVFLVSILLLALVAQPILAAAANEKNTTSGGNGKGGKNENNSTSTTTGTSKSNSNSTSTPQMLHLLLWDTETVSLSRIHPISSGVEIPNFTFPTSSSPQQNTDNNTNTNNTRNNGPGNLHFVLYQTPGQNGEPAMFFFTPFYVDPQEQKPRASEKAMNNLPIIEITQNDEQCPVCLDNFIKGQKQEEQQTENGDEKKENSDKEKVVREMPCKHLFCESCLFEWLRQNNTCPLCRFEIESQDQDTSTAPDININPQEQTPSPPQQTHENNDNHVNSSIPTASSRQSQPRTRYAQHRHPYYPTSRTNYRHSNQLTSCSLERVGCCEENNLNQQQHTPIITLPQCHHRFHAACLRTSLLVEGYSLETTSPLSFRCPSCRASANLEIQLSRP
ncbi:415_t:CDS:2 [Ambispora gerdemannii]|uniref:415_t:CDS:1 n=1 Tax=Ambispora gerdemannii TaxID=144530 RepID=A0A9N8ZH33_9GLOM|nr:415_t:CDS:2 [Ambispora gerdemannii]